MLAKKQQTFPKRIMKEIQRFKNCPPGIAIKAHEENLRYFDIEIKGPPDTPYEGGLFKLEMFLDNTWPMKPPKCRFLTRIYHPNVDAVGRICLSILKPANWSPALTIPKVCLSIQSLLQEPNPDDPLDNKVAAVWKSNLPAAEKTAKEWTQIYAV
eukprot:CAMPEP_0197036890 /NCGR_PEP_ID=MMETSP1384-20130603/14251_1 /TAXON_ID=29189 /ORGANISM="Ammonia sp." /LENGTH=154 /DNA_ID=CAMNT_0042467117 /DNA_START=103 /DNA_END=567 /DNA_ORIENTATION=-